MERRAGYKKTEIGWIPEDWEVVKTEKISLIKGGNGFPTKFQGNNVGEVPFIKVSDMNSYGNEKYIFFSNNYITKELVEYLKLTLFNPNTIVFAKVGAALLLNRRRILTRKTVIDNNMMGIIPKENIITEFLYQYFLRVDFSKFVQEGALPSINQKMVGSIPIHYPPLPEQQKIAEILTTVDDKISSIEDQIQQTEQLKKGLMKKLLTEGIGHTEFKDTEIGRIPTKWDLRLIGDFVETIKGGASLKPSDFTSNGFKVLPKKGVVAGGILKIDEKEQAFCSIEYAESNISNVIDQEYLITTLRDLVPTGPSIGYIVKFNSLEKYILAQGVYGFKITGYLDRDFLIQFSNTKKYRKVMQTIMVGSTQVHIRNKDFLNVKIPYPPLPEQKQIASILTAVDDKIEILKSKKTEYQTLKKGLMAELLTGKRRVKI